MASGIELWPEPVTSRIRYVASGFGAGRVGVTAGRKTGRAAGATVTPVPSADGSPCSTWSISASASRSRIVRACPALTSFLTAAMNCLR